MIQLRYLIAGLIYLSFSTLSGQTQGDQAATQVYGQGQMLKTFDLAERGMEGPMHLLDENTTATVVWKVGGDSSVTESGNYHLYLDQFVFVEDEKEKSIDFERIKLFRLEQPGSASEFVHTSLLSDKPFEGKTSFLEKIYYDEKESISMWKYWFINEVPPNYNQALNTGSKNTMLKRRSQYVLLKEGEWYINFKLKKAAIREAFPEKAADLTKYVKANKLDDSSEGLSQFVSYVNKGD